MREGNLPDSAFRSIRSACMLLHSVVWANGEQWLNCFECRLLQWQIHVLSTASQCSPACYLSTSSCTTLADQTCIVEDQPKVNHITSSAGKMQAAFSTPQRNRRHPALQHTPQCSRLYPSLRSNINSSSETTSSQISCASCDAGQKCCWWAAGKTYLALRSNIHKSSEPTSSQISCAYLCCRTKVLLVGSGRDRLLPSLTEQARLQRLLPNAQRLVLPESGHTALLEVCIMLQSLPTLPNP